VTDTWDDDDRAIARALGADAADAEAIGDDAPLDDRAVAEYEAVLAHLPFDAVEPAPELEESVIAAALARRPAAARAMDRRRTARDPRRSVSRRWIGAGVALVAAAAIIVALAVSRPTTGPGNPGARIQPAAATDSVARVLAAPGTREGVLRTGTAASVGRVALGLDGQGYLYDLSTARSSPQWLWLETATGAVRVGRMPAASTVHFVVRGDVEEVKGVFVTNDATPGSPTARAELS
jgi:hypothetical protein